jgi:hypothetical protein
MRSTPSLDRGRFTLPRDLFAAAVTAATLVLAIVVLGWLTSGLITGVWSPREQAATVTHAAVTIATPSERDDAPRPAQAHASVRPAASRPAPARADTAPAERVVRRAPRVRKRATAKPAPAAPVVTQTARPAPVVAASPVSTATEATTGATADTDTTTSERRTSQVSTPASSWQDDSRREWRQEASDDDDNGRRRRSVSRSPWRQRSAQPTPTPVQTPAPTADNGDDRHGWDRGEHRGWDRDGRDRGRWGR